MEDTLVREIKFCIEEKIKAGYHKFIIFPFGDIGAQVKHILNEAYGIQETLILDNHLCNFNEMIQPLSFVEGLDRGEYCLFLSTADPKLYGVLKADVEAYFEEENIAWLPSAARAAEIPRLEERFSTKIGRYSYGPLCRNHRFIESIGSFCSFAVGTDVVMNHEVNYITTHPMISAGAEGGGIDYDEQKIWPYYFPDVSPKEEKVEKARRIHIGNDVWLGRNVIVTNYANIGNGVIAGAGAVITKDVPDYAVVTGVPARILRYRYTPEQIDSLNRIAWWDWTDEEIRLRYDDFYLPIDKFIKKYQGA